MVDMVHLWFNSKHILQSTSAKYLVLEEFEIADRHEMAEVESIIQQASLFLSAVGLETHAFKVGKFYSYFDFILY